MVLSVPANIPLGAKGCGKLSAEFESPLNEPGAKGWGLVQRADGFYFFKTELAGS